VCVCVCVCCVCVCVCVCCVCVTTSMGVWLGFKRDVGRVKAKAPELVSSKCGQCPAGDPHPCCDHILTAITAVELLGRGEVTGGNVGDGQRAWGPGSKKIKTSHVACQNIMDIALLTRSARLSRFLGRRPEAPPPKCHLQDFIGLLQCYGSPTLPITIVELHNGYVSPPLRRNQLAEHTQRRKSFPPGQIRHTLFSLTTPPFIDNDEYVDLTMMHT